MFSASEQHRVLKCICARVYTVLCGTRFDGSKALPARPDILYMSRLYMQETHAYCKHVFLAYDNTCKTCKEVSLR